MTIIIDTETTGLRPDQDELLQVAIIDDTGKTLIDQYVRPTRCDEWPEAERVNHISPEMVRDCPAISDPAVHDVIQSVLYQADKIMGYNTQFDIGFLIAAGFDVPICETKDIMIEFAEVYGDYSEYYESYVWKKLTVAAEYYGYEWPVDAHNALGDCLATLYVYRCMQNKKALRPCPFCGENMQRMQGDKIFCDVCGIVISSLFPGDEPQELIQRYNRRAEDRPHGVPTDEEMDKMLDDVMGEDDYMYQRCDRCGTYVHRDSMYNGVCSECCAEEEAESKKEGWKSVRGYIDTMLHEGDNDE